MRTVPKGRVDRIAFYETRVSKWTAHAAAIGTSDERVALLATKTTEARLALRERQQAENAARSATLRFNSAVREMGEIGATIMLQIRAHTSTPDNGVYSLASIPPPAKHKKIAPPGRPHSFQINLQAIGILTLMWKCDNPRGAGPTIYRVFRRIDAIGGPAAGRPVGDFVYQGHVGRRRKFVDQTLPAGTASVTYRIQAMRSTAAGDAALFNVNFGGCGAMVRPMLLKKAQRAA